MDTLGKHLKNVKIFETLQKHWRTVEKHLKNIRETREKHYRNT